MFLCGKHLKKGVGLNVQRQNHYLDSCKQGLLFIDICRITGVYWYKNERKFMNTMHLHLVKLDKIKKERKEILCDIHVY